MRAIYSYLNSSVHKPEVYKIWIVTLSETNVSNTSHMHIKVWEQLFLSGAPTLCDATVSNPHL